MAPKLRQSTRASCRKGARTARERFGSAHQCSAMPACPHRMGLLEQRGIWTDARDRASIGIGGLAGPEQALLAWEHGRGGSGRRSICLLVGASNTSPRLHMIPRDFVPTELARPQGRDLVATFGGRYDGSPVIVQDGTQPPPDSANSYTPTACPGGRPPHAWMEDGRSLYDLFHTEWTLLALGPTPPDTSQFERAADHLRLDMRVVSLPSSDLQALYEAPLALIRPDQMVAWRGQMQLRPMRSCRKPLADRRGSS
jgi:hypothetical protein